MKKYLLIAVAALAIASCSEKKYHVEGSIAQAKDSLLVFENVGIEEITVVDSIRLGCASVDRLSTCPSTLLRRLPSRPIIHRWPRNTR